MKANLSTRTRRLAAIMFTDIVGYTSLMQTNESEAADLRTHHRQVFEQTHQQHNGDILQYFGDGTLSVFQSGVEAVACAIAIQQLLRTQTPVVPLRIGLHLGDIVFDGTDIFGDGVNLASRIENLGVAGAILLSKKLNAELQNHPDFQTNSMGQFELKNVEQPVEIFAVKADNLYLPASSELQGQQHQPAQNIAVLPFVNLSGDEEQEYFSDGMTEEIINALSKIEGLRVTSRTSSFYFKNRKIPLPQIGRELNVSTILEGSIRLSGQRMRLTAQLIDVREDVPFWSERFNRSIEDIFAVQDEISLLIADKLREWVGHFDIGEQLVEAPAVTVDLYQQYLKGRYHVLQMSPAEVERALQIFQAILQQQPNFALAHLGINQSYTILGAIGFMPVEQAFAKGQEHLARAIQLDPKLPECQIQLSWKSFLQDWDWKSTYQHLQQSANIRPTVEYYQSMTSTLSAEKKLETAHHYIDIAIQLDPFSAINQHLKGFSYYQGEQYEQALHQWLPVWCNFD
ncbi:MAG: adenylate/guanylate cyclase domain-containing protein [Bacteroidota bacterium]